MEKYRTSRSTIIILKYLISRIVYLHPNLSLATIILSVITLQMPCLATQNLNLNIGLKLAFSQSCTLSYIQNLIDNLQNPWQQSRAKNQLMTFCGHTAIPILIRSLKTEPSPAVRTAIAETIAHIGGTQAIEALTIALKTDSSYIVQRTAAEGLGSIRDSSSAQSLIESLQDVSKDSSVREVSAEALGLVGGRSAINALTDTLKNTSESPNLRNISAQALEKIGEPAIDSLVELLDDSDLQTRYYTVRTLSKINSFRSNNTLQENQAKITEILEDAIKAEMVEFDRVPAAAAGRGTRDALRRPIICYIDWIAKNWDRCN